MVECIFNVVCCWLFGVFLGFYKAEQRNILGCMFFWGGVRVVTVYLKKGALCKSLGYVFLLMLWFLVSGKAYAYVLKTSYLSNSYSGCYFRDNGNGTSTVSTVIDYKPMAGHTGGSDFKSRGILVYSYDKNGRPISSSTPATVIYINGLKSDNKYNGEGYIMFYNSVGIGDWGEIGAFLASVKVTINNSAITNWPAVAIRAGNYTRMDDVGEAKGAVYISRSGPKNGACILLADPGSPPPLDDIYIDVSAPDWNLGELQHGLSDTPLTRADQMLCFSYDAASVKNKKFVIGASSANGVVNNQYRLKHLSDTSQVVPYSLTLASGSTLIKLPGSNIELPLADSGRSCFSPTFRTEVGRTVKEGDYNDVLTFTVTTKS